MLAIFAVDISRLCPEYQVCNKLYEVHECKDPVHPGQFGMLHHKAHDEWTSWGTKYGQESPVA